MQFTYTLLRTTFALGPINVLRVIYYKLSLKLPLSYIRRLSATVPTGPFYPTPTSSGPNTNTIERWRKSGLLFGYIQFPIDFGPPDWFSDPITGKRFLGPDRVWWRIPDFDGKNGDIKRIWELSRFEWVIAFAQHARSGDATAIVRLNLWLADWSRINLPFRGPNWKCGQEASIRVVHLATAAIVLYDEIPFPTGLLEMIEVHLTRIEPTVGYAKAQDNNHGISEAAALFIGGSWLRRSGRRYAEKWEKLGRTALEERAQQLFQKDGSFSQYSTNYHRMALDLYSVAELWRRIMAADRFSNTLIGRLRVAAEWLHRITDALTGDAPVLGANDGARLIPLTDAPYRDYRPTVALARALFADVRAWPDPSPWEPYLHWLRVSVPQDVAPTPDSDSGDSGGFAVLKRERALAVLRYPLFRFRPAHSDALHLDFWIDGKNICRDSGTYSYNTAPEIYNYFTGPHSHNTIQFDHEDQMPRLSRFLFGDWLTTDFFEPLKCEAERVSFAAGYTDRRKRAHRRLVTLYKREMHVVDDIFGFRKNAILRWKLYNFQWTLRHHAIQSNFVSIAVSGTVPITRFELVDGFESRHYLERTKTPTLEVEVMEAGTLVTIFRW